MIQRPTQEFEAQCSGMLKDIDCFKVFDDARVMFVTEMVGQTWQTSHLRCLDFYWTATYS